MLRVEEINDIDALEDYRERWETLLGRSSSSDLFGSYEWLTSWLNAFWRGKPIAFLFVWREERLVGLVPLLQDVAGELWCPKTLTFPVNPQTRRADIVCEGEPDEIVDAALGYLRQRGQPVRIGLKRVRDDAALLGVLPQVAARHHMLTNTKPDTEAPILELEKDWQSYLSSRSRHFRSELRRKRKAMTRAGTAEWRVVSSVEEVNDALDEVFSIERDSWKESEGTSLTTESGLTTFYRDLALQCARSGWLRIYLLQLDSRPIAHVFGVVFDGQLYALKTSYRQEYHHLSPGAVLFGYVVEDGFAQGYRLLDFLGDKSRWKNEMATGSRQHVNMCVFSASMPKCRFCRLLEHTVKPAVREKASFVTPLARWASRWLPAPFR